MKLLLPLLTIFLASQSSAQEGEIRGRMICEVIDSRLVAARGEAPSTFKRYGNDFELGMSLNMEYALDDEGALLISLFEADGKDVLIDELFSADTFRGVSAITSVAEFRASYSEVSFGRFGISYKGSDQLFLKNGCADNGWLGHFVQTYVGGHLTEVVSLKCRPFVDAMDEVFARLSISG